MGPKAASSIQRRRCVRARLLSVGRVLGCVGLICKRILWTLGWTQTHCLTHPDQPPINNQIAMLGGKMAAAGAVDGAEQQRKDKGKATAAMPVSEFMDKGLGGAQLPRKRQDRKEKEKEKSE